MTARPHLEHVVEEVKSHRLRVGFLHHPEEGDTKFGFKK
jgi:hypothetical protein